MSFFNLYKVKTEKNGVLIRQVASCHAAFGQTIVTLIIVFYHLVVRDLKISQCELGRQPLH